MGENNIFFKSISEHFLSLQKNELMNKYKNLTFLQVNIISILLSSSLIVLFLTSCNSKKVDAPVLSGILWGGEGSRLIIRHIMKTDIPPDTIIIDNKGEFVWNPENFISGMYYLENLEGKKIIFILDSEKPQFIDGLFAIFPNHLKTKDTELPELFLKIENICNSWNYELSKISSQVEENIKNLSLEYIKEIHTKLDSIRLTYQEKVLSVSDEPLVKMIVLLQTAGNNPLFDMWRDRVLFFEVDSNLKPYMYLNEVLVFSQKVAELREIEQQHSKIKVGYEFPSLIYENDTVFINNYPFNFVYIEIRKSDTSPKSPDLSKYQKDGLEKFVIIADETDNYSEICNQLGIMQFPSNYLINKEGIIAAKNVWGTELFEALEIIFQK